MNILNTKNLVLSILFLLSFCLNLNAQKPKKIFNYLQDNQLNLAVEEYNKISSNIEYDNEEMALFKIANCLFSIDTNYQKYNPIQAIKDFNGTYINPENKVTIYKFLEKYGLNLEKISEKINTEIYIQAKKISTVEAYKNAFDVCSFQYKDDINKRLEVALYNRIKVLGNISQLKDFTIKYPESVFKNEIQILLERNTFIYYKSINNIDSLSYFLNLYKNSKFQNEVTRIKDSLNINLIKNDYNKLYKFSIDNPESNYIPDIQVQLKHLLFKQLEDEKFDIELTQKFILLYPFHEKVNEIDSVIFNKVRDNDSVRYYQKYLSIFPNGKYREIAIKLINDKTITEEEIRITNELKTLIGFSKCENIYDFTSVYLQKLYNLNSVYTLLNSAKLDISPDNIKYFRFNNETINDNDSSLIEIIHQIRTINKVPEIDSYLAMNNGIYSLSIQKIAYPFLTTITEYSGAGSNSFVLNYFLVSKNKIIKEINLNSDLEWKFKDFVSSSNSDAVKKLVLNKIILNFKKITESKYEITTTGISDNNGGNYTIYINANLSNSNLILENEIKIYDNLNLIFLKKTIEKPKEAPIKKKTNQIFECSDVKSRFGNSSKNEVINLLGKPDRNYRTDHFHYLVYLNIVRDKFDNNKLKHLCIKTTIFFYQGDQSIVECLKKGDRFDMGLQYLILP